MDQNGNFEVKVTIEELEAYRAAVKLTIKQVTEDKNGLFILIRQLKNGETSLEDVFINGDQLRIVKPDAPATNGAAPTVPTTGENSNGSNSTEELRGPTMAEPETELATTGGGSKRRS